MKATKLVRSIASGIFLTVTATSVIAQKTVTGNPIIKTKYTADPGAFVYKDSVFLYTGHDEAPPGKEGYMMHEWLCFSSADMVHWKEHAIPLTVKDFTWAKDDAWASQVIERNGKFYWYVYGLFFGNVVLLPLWLQQYMGYTATDAGMALAPVGILAILLSPLVGKNIGRIDPRWMATVAFLLFALVLSMRANFTTQTDFATIMVPTILQGAALALFFIPLTTLTLTGLAPDRLPAAAGLSNFVRITAGSMGVSISTTLWESRATLHHAHLTERLSLGDPVAGETLAGLRAAGLTADQALTQINRLIDQQAYTRAADDIFLASGAVFVLLIAALWLTRRPPKTASTSVDAGGAH